MKGEDLDVSTVRDDEGADASGIPNAAALLAFTTAAVRGDEQTLAAARERVLAELGPAGLVDTSAIIGNFQRMTRIADSTGIPLDAEINAMSVGIQDQLRLTEFGSAANTSRPGLLASTIGRAVRPFAFRLFSFAAARGRK